jgi:hypothetical protein
MKVIESIAACGYYFEVRYSIASCIMAVIYAGQQLVCSAKDAVPLQKLKDIA